MPNSKINFNSNFKDFFEKSLAYNALVDEIKATQDFTKIKEYEDTYFKLVQLSVEELILNWKNKGTIIFINNSPTLTLGRTNSKQLQEFFNEPQPKYINLLGKHVKSIVRHLLSYCNEENGLSLERLLEKEVYEFKNMSNNKNKAYKPF